jgi:hypothetical protein
VILVHRPIELAVRAGPRASLLAPGRSQRRVVDRKVEIVRFASAVVIVTCMACGAGSKPEASTSNSALAKNADDGGTSATDAGTETQAFAGSTAEATELISAAVDKKHSDISACVREFRTRKKMVHKRVSVSFGIDQEGKVLGVTSKGKEDTELKTCVQDALKGAPFPRSHAGVITVTKSYEDILQ